MSFLDYFIGMDVPKSAKAKVPTKAAAKPAPQPQSEVTEDRPAKGPNTVTITASNDEKSDKGGVSNMRNNATGPVKNSDPLDGYDEYVRKTRQPEQVSESAPFIIPSEDSAHTQSKPTTHEVTQPVEERKIAPEDKAAVVAALKDEAIARIRLEAMKDELVRDAALPENALYHATKIGSKWYYDEELPGAIDAYEKVTGEKPQIAVSGWYKRDDKGKLLVSRPATEDEIILFRYATQH